MGTVARMTRVRAAAKNAFVPSSTAPPAQVAAPPCTSPLIPDIRKQMLALVASRSHDRWPHVCRVNDEKTAVLAGHGHCPGDGHRYILLYPRILPESADSESEPAHFSARSCICCKFLQSLSLIVHLI